MIKQIATGLAAVAATSALAIAVPTAANASTADWDSWGPVYSQNYKAKAEGRVEVRWDHDEESNTVSVRGRLWDLDHRTAEERGKCAYVKFQAADFDDDWSTVWTQKYCGYPDYAPIRFRTHDVSSLRVKVCQIHEHGGFVRRCGHWEEIYTADAE
ncbi:hypothetical protein [Nonomuraea rhizosphaerae]|uniref:hypothetical protein n=1 Tax=Nonomuraea rhizosphaerae TaxID=2665663 RepID=UPI001C601A39|nr:hypothetical protein [Nonomuraea rhizosphaerae]